MSDDPGKPIPDRRMARIVEERETRPATVIETVPEFQPHDIGDPFERLANRLTREFVALYASIDESFTQKVATEVAGLLDTLQQDSGGEINRLREENAALRAEIAGLRAKTADDTKAILKEAIDTLRAENA
jgi:hypothetical protein